MESIVIEMQREATRTGADVAELVRKAYVVATKIGLEDFAEWAKRELDGYTEGKIPDYRVIPVETKAWNPFRGWIPMMFGSAGEAKLFSNASVGMAIGEIQNLLIKNKESHLVMPFPPEIKHQLMQDANVPLEPTRHVSPSQLSGILDGVRNVILEWTLRLEREGILGDGIVFSSAEREKADKEPSLHIGNFIQGNVVGSALGSVSGPM